MDILNLGLVFLLIALTAFFVASEFAIVKIRSSRIDQLVAEGNTRAITAKKVVSHLDEYLSACQLGITITSLGLGWLGEPTIERMLRPLFVQFNAPESVTSVVSFVIAFASITFLHVVVGELAPKTIAIQKAETVTLFFATPLILFYKIMYPFIWVLNGSARVITSSFGLKSVSEHELAHTEEELRIILSESYKSGEINQSEFKYVNKIFEFDNRVAKEVMVPRTEIVSLDISCSLEEALQIIGTEKYTRYPIIDGDKDHILGIVNTKEVFTDFIVNKDIAGKTLEYYVRPVIQVIESISVQNLLLKMQKERIHMAILVDEYGGTAGLVTVEDILEEIVGEIQDEFDADEVPVIRKVKEDHYIVDAKILVNEVNDLLGLDLEDDDVDTIGGLILTQKYDIKQGQIITIDSYQFKVLEMKDFHIKFLEIWKPKKSQAGARDGIINPSQAVSL